MSLFIKIFSWYNTIKLAILYPTSLANLVVEVGTRHSHQILLILTITYQELSIIIITSYAHSTFIRIVLNITRHSGNDNTPQPTDQRMDSPSMGQQIRNCNSFASMHHLTNVFGKSKIAQWVQLCIRLTSFSLQVKWASHSWDMFIWKF